MANPSYTVELHLFLMYPGGNLAFKKAITLPFIPFKNLSIQLNTDEEDEENCVYVEHIKYNTASKKLEVYCEEIEYLSKEYAEKNSPYYINTLGFTRTK